MPTPFVVGVTYGNLLGHMNTRTDTSGYLAVSGVSKSFGHTVAVSGVSISVTRGETLAILGPSGCGKTTLLRVSAGLESPDVGSISLDGNVLVDGQSFVRPERRRIGMVFQGLALFPHMTVAENVGYGLARHADRSRRVGDALALVDMAGFESRAPESLSGGQAQRVALARALAPQPDVLLLDEPFASLDAELRIRVRAEVAALLRALEITAVFVTHDQEEAFVVGDHVAVMRDGSVVQTGTPTELYERPTSAWIARFVGEANVVEGDARGGLVDTVLGSLPLVDALQGPCRVVVRPEHIVIRSGESGSVAGVEFYGHDTAYRLTVADTPVTARAMTPPRFGVGHGVDVGYEGPPVVAFPESPAASEAVGQRHRGSNVRVT